MDVVIAQLYSSGVIEPVGLSACFALEVQFPDIKTRLICRLQVILNEC